MAERPNALALKASMGNTIGGSNPSVSATAGLFARYRVVSRGRSRSNHASVQVFPGHTTEVHYSAPAQIYLKGALGAERQATPGVALSYVALAFCVLLIVAWIALAI